MENKKHSKFYTQEPLDMFLKNPDMFPMHYFLCKAVSEKKNVLDFFESLPDSLVESYIESAENMDWFTIKDENIQSDLLVTTTALNLLENCWNKGIKEKDLRKKVGVLLVVLTQQSVNRKVKRETDLEISFINSIPCPADPWNLSKMKSQLDKSLKIQEQDAK